MPHPRDWPARNRRYALAAAGFLLLLYGTLGVTPRAVGALSGWLGASRLYTLVVLVLLGALAMVLWQRRAVLLPPRRDVWAALLWLGGCYALSFLTVQSPATGLHLLFYGVLAWLVTEALRGMVPAARLHGRVLLVALPAGLVDEGIQWLLPNRHGVAEDVHLNWNAALLALVLMRVLGDDGTGPAGTDTDAPGAGGR